MKSEETKRLSLKGNIIWNSVGSIIYQVCIWLITVMVLWISGLEDGGILTVAMSVSNIFFTVAIYGMRAYQTSDLNSKYSDKEYILSRFVTSGAAVLLCFFTVLIMRYSLLSAASVMLYMLFRISEALMDVLHGIDQRFMRMDIIGKSFIMRGVVAVISFALSLWLLGNIALALLIMAAASFVTVIIYDFPAAARLGDFKKPASAVNIRRLLAECFPLVVYSFLNTAVANIPRIILESVHGETAAGIFGAIGAPTVIVQLGATYAFTPLISGFAKAYIDRDKKKFFRLTLIVCGVIAAIGVVSVIGGALLCDWGLTLLYSSNEQVFEGVMLNKALLVPIIVTTVVTAYVLFFNMLLTIVREFKGLVASNIIGLAACIGFCSFMIKKWYLQGTNLALMAALLLQLVSLAVFLAAHCKKYFFESAKQADNAR